MFRILIVEDDKELRSLFERVLVKNGYTVSQTANGQQALDAIDRE